MDEIDLDTVVKAASEQVSADMSGEAVILSLDKGEYFGLNEVGSRVWALIAEPRKVADVCHAIEGEYNVASGRCEEDVMDLLRRMVAEGLVQVSE